MPGEVIYPARSAAHKVNAIVASDSCAGLPVAFTLSRTSDVQAIQWDFGDPASGAGNQATGLNVSTVYAGAGTYTVKAIVSYACATDTLVRTVQIASPAAPVTGFSYPASVCQLGTNPSPTLGTGFTPGGTFSGTPGLAIDPVTGSIDVAASTPGIHMVTYSLPASAAPCRAAGSSSASIEIRAASSPITGFRYRSPVCAHTEALAPTLDFLFTPNGVFSTTPGLSLDSGSGTITPASSPTGSYPVTYTVEASVSTCHTGGASITTVVIEPTAYPVTGIAYPTPVCSDTTPLAPVLAPGMTPGGIFHAVSGLALDPASGIVRPDASIPGNYIVSYATPEAGCRVAGSSSSPLIVVKAFVPVTAFGYQEPLCTVLATAQPVLPTSFTYGGVFSGEKGVLINGLTGGIDLVRTPPGNYVVTYTAPQRFCTRGNQQFSDTITIQPVEIPVTDFAFPEILSCEDTLFLPELAPGFSPDGVFTSSSRLTISPVTGEVDREASGLGQFTIYYEVEGEGCRIPRGGVAEVVVPDCTCRLVLPDAFTPNGDDANAVFGPFVTCRVEGYQCSIYDRWGARVFRTGSLDFPWDGLLPDGKPAPEGVYLAKVEGVFPDGRDIQVAGTVMLVR